MEEIIALVSLLLVLLGMGVGSTIARARLRKDGEEFSGESGC